MMRPRHRGPAQRVDEFVARFVVLRASRRRWPSRCRLHNGRLTPREHAVLTIVSPEKQTGKRPPARSLGARRERAVHTVSTTESAPSARSSETGRAFCSDEIDRSSARSRITTEPLRAALNGATRPGVHGPRTVGKGQRWKSGFSGSARRCARRNRHRAAARDNQDRSITLHMKRRRNGRRWSGCATVSSTETQRHSGRVGGVGDETTGCLHEPCPSYPTGSATAPADGWEPLFAIADSPARVGRAKRVMPRGLSAQARDDESSLRTLLLATTRAAIGDRHGISPRCCSWRSTTTTSCRSAGERRKGVDATGLAKLLKPYGVKPVVLRIGDELHAATGPRTCAMRGSLPASAT